MKGFSKRNVAIMIVLIFTTAIITGGCSGMGGTADDTTGAGAFRVSVQWPDGGKTERFIPDDAKTILVEITGSGLETAKTASITYPDTELTVEDIPTGSKVALLMALDESSNLLVQRQEGFIICNGQTEDSENVALGVAVKQDGTNVFFEPSEITVPANVDLPFQNWTNSAVTITGVGINLPLSGAYQDGVGKWFFPEGSRTVTGAATAGMSEHPGTCAIGLPAMTWRGAQIIDAGPGNSACWARIAIDSNGNAFCVFYQYVGSDQRIYARRYNAASSSWQSAQIIDAGAGNSLGYVDIDFDSNGNAFCVFQRSDGSKTRIYANRYDAASSSWQSAATIDNGPGNNAQDPKLAFDSNGNAFCVFMQFDGTSYKTYARHYNAISSTWQPTQIIGTLDGRGGRDVAFDSAGNAICAFRQVYTGHERVYVNRYVAASSSWQTAQLIGAGNGNRGEPQLAIDPAGNAFCVYEQIDTIYRVYARRYDAASSSWQTAQVLDAGYVNNDEDTVIPKIAADSNGNVICVFGESDNSINRIYTRRYSASSSTWQALQIIDPEGGIRSLYPHVAIDSSGNAFCVFQKQFVSPNFIVYACRYDATSSSWQSAEVIDAGMGGEGARRPDAAFDPAGNAICVFHQYDGVIDRIYANRYE